MIMTHHSSLQAKASIVGILCFEIAKTMCRLVSLYNSTSDDHILRLKTHLMKSVGVSYLNSNDETFLLSLACSERLEDLDRAAATVSRLAHKCSHNHFHHDLRRTTRKLAVGSKTIQRMEKYVAATSVLYREMECLREMEGRERRIQQWKKTLSPEEREDTNFDLFDQKIGLKRIQVGRCKQMSLWNHTFDKCVALMAPLVSTLYSRIKNILETTHQHFHIQSQSRIVPESDHCLIAHRDWYTSRHKAPKVVRQRKGVYLMAASGTVGGSGLTLRYANVILLAKRCLSTTEMLSDGERGMVYEMLPARVKAAVRGKCMRRKERDNHNEAGKSLASGWREAVEGIMEWLMPMALDTLRWQPGRQSMDSKPTVLLLQTLHYSDLEKTETAITEVLVGLTCIYNYEHRRPPFRPRCFSDSN